MTDTLIDGRASDRLPADDRGLLYGDHLFETIAFHDGVAPLWDRHWQRLSTDSHRLGLVPPSRERLLAECRQLAPAGSSCVIRVTLTRGSGGRAYEPPTQPSCRRIVQRRPWPQSLAGQQTDGLRLMTSPVRLASGSVLAGMKHGNRLEQVLAARACAQSSFDEALLFDVCGQLIEAISSNLLLVADGRALTPKIDGAGVAGVGLGWLVDQPETDIATASLTAAELARAGEVMVINSVAGIRPVTAIDERPLRIGPVCRDWQRLWARRLNG